MASTFQFDILTPERCFFSGQVDALTFSAEDGEWTILKDHAPMIAVLRAGCLRFRQGDVWREAVNSEGYMEVAGDGVVLFAQTCEWPEEIDIARAKHTKEEAEEGLRQSRSISEYKANKLMLARAMARLRNSHQQVNMD